MTIRLAVDCMGGDHGPGVTVPAALHFVKKADDVELILVGDQLQLQSVLSKHKVLNHPHLHIQHADEVVLMDDSIEVALRRKKKSSMHIALQLVKDGQASACISAGNTGALMAVSRYLLKTMAGIDRPAICAAIPNQKDKPTYMLDLGANVDCNANHLHQFAIMGSALVCAIENISKPTIGLLNVGSEEIKGNEVVKQVTELLRQDHERGVLNFYGNVEGNDIFAGTTDIVVCDGFVGNVTLKAVEGLGHFIKNVIRTEIKSNFLNMLGAAIATGAFLKISKRLNPARYNGACLVGLRGLVFKSHGNANSYAFTYALQRAAEAVRHDVLSQISDIMSRLITANELQDTLSSNSSENM